jgi:aromatic ring-opening dioxygenase catalytic subunit (LigB family)
MDAGALHPSRQFDDWLQKTLTQSSATDRYNNLLEWSHAPAARFAHPTEDHLIPLMVAVGAAEQDVGTCVYHEDAFMGSAAASSFRFGGHTD